MPRNDQIKCQNCAAQHDIAILVIRCAGDAILNSFTCPSCRAVNSAATPKESFEVIGFAGGD